MTTTPMRRLRRLVLVVTGLLLAGTLAGAGWLGWRLAQGPMPLPWLTPRLESALRSPDGAWRSRIGTTLLAWDPRVDRVRLHLGDVAVVGDDGQPIAELAGVDADLALGELLRGRIAIGALDLERPLLHVDLADTGRPGLDRGDLARLLACDAAVPAIRVLDGGIVIEATGGDPGWRLDAARLELRRDDDATRITLAAAVPVGPSAAALDVSLERACDGARTAGTLSLSGVDGGALAAHLADAPAAAAVLPLLRALPGPVALALRATHDPATDDVVVQELRLASANLGLRGHGRVVGLSGPGRAVATVAAGGTDVSTVMASWPPGFQPALRAWLAPRLSAGRVRAARLRVRASLTGGDPWTLVPQGLDAALTMDRVRIRAVDALPPLVGVAARARVDDAGWRVRVRRGRCDQLVVDDGLVRGLPAASPPEIGVTATLHGPVVSAATLLGKLGKPLPAGIGTAGLGGTVAADIVAGIPMQRGAVRLAATARLRDLRVANVLNGQALTGGDVQVEASDPGVRVHGRALLGGAPLTLDWRETTTPRASRRASGVLRTTDATRAALGVRVEPWVTGPFDLHLDLDGTDPAGPTLDLDADLAPADVEIPAIAIRKAAGQPGRATAALVLRGWTPVTVTGATLTAAGTRVQGRGRRATPTAPWSDVRIDTVIPPGAGASSPGHLTLTLQPQGGRHAFHLSSDDSGALLRALDAYSEVRGGRLTMDGTVALTADDRPWDGTLVVTDATLLRSPFLARVVRLASIDGLVHALDGAGIRLTKVSGQLSGAGARMDLRNGRVESPSFGLLLAGTIDHRTDQAQLQGTLVPSWFGVNTALTKIPLVGTLMTGGKGEGIQAFDFKVSGPLADPKVSVDPFSSAAPGVLRDLLRAIPLPR